MFARDVEELFESAESLSANDIMAAASVRALRLPEAFDIVADCGLVKTEWHQVWMRAQESVKIAALRSRRGDVQEAALAAADAAGGAALALYLSSRLEPTDYERLIRPWRQARRAVMAS